MLVLSLLSTPHVHAQQQVSLSFSNVDISQVAKAIGAATDTTIIVDPRVKGQLNLVSDNPVSKELALKTLESALRMQGFSLVRDNGILKVVPEADAKLQGVPTYVGNTPKARGDHVITQVFRLRNESANNLLPALKPLVSPNNTIAAYPADNTLIVTDYADNVRRIADIIAGVDGNASQRVAVVPLNHESAVDLEPIVQKMLDPSAVGNTDATLKVSVTADSRINALLLRASDPGRIRDAKALIAQLDAPTRVPGNMHVVRLQNANSVELAKVLRGMLGLGGGDSASDSDKSSKSFNDNNGGFGSKSGSNGSSGNGGSSSTGTPGMPPLPSSSDSTGGSTYGSGASGPGGQGGLIAGARGGAPGSDNGSGGMIQADPATNSLVVTAPEPVYRNVRNVIDQLDVRRAQVYLEAMIVEMSATSAANLGVQWQGALQSNGGNNILYGTSNFNVPPTSQGIVNLTAQGQSIAQNLSTAATTTLLNNGVNIGLIHKFGNIFGLGALVQALSTVSDASILSSPNLITLDNEEARIVVGSNVPIQTGSIATGTTVTSGSVSAFNTFDREDVGIVLHVKPQITHGGAIKLQIYSEDSSVDQSSINNPGGVTIIKRSVQSTVLSDDGEIVVLGGLIQDSYADGNNKVPLLGDIPLIGSLFRAENKARTKTNVMVFLRPVIIRDGQTLADISTNRYDYVRGQTLDQSTDNRIIRDHDVPVLPPPAPPPSQGVPAQNGIFDLNQMRRPVPPPPTGPVGAAPAAPASDVSGAAADSTSASVPTATANGSVEPNVTVGAPTVSAAQPSSAVPLLDPSSSAGANYQRTDQP
ncbi:Type 3 secretion system secretin [Paraburkholderia humisilvae]|uniref:Type 3 secretion system secretin n=2 Tax=Paraburkholderia humisilvae TaxID=627669 RepID=A0A6J5F557_9BURK|nr:type II secretion system secretin GspD [Paraburkholderia humisilvae]CAB3772455.1 Type 3 secretion system secretin [Paraburkholderia humisilvae]